MWFLFHFTTDDFRMIAQMTTGKSHMVNGKWPDVIVQLHNIYCIFLSHVPLQTITLGVTLFAIYHL